MTRFAVALATVGLLAVPVLAAPPAFAVRDSPAARPAEAAAAPCDPGTAERHGEFGHDTTSVSPAVKERVQRDLAAFTAARHARAARTGADVLPEQIVVPVRIHVIHGTHKKDRKVSRAEARRLFRHLQGGFAGAQDPTMEPTGIRFVLRPITVTRNDRWFHAAPGSRADRQMHRKLHHGTRQTLNLYLNSVTAEGGSLLGIARFPWLAGPYPRLDGVTINVASLPGGRARGYNLGDTAIHEVGHWFGLFHTFEGGCEAPGDYVKDTEAEAEPSFACELKRDSCPTPLPEGWIDGDPEPEPVPDPVRNFMDYSHDSCMTHFTPGQRIRAVSLFLRYRYGR